VSTLRCCQQCLMLIPGNPGNKGCQQSVCTAHPMMNRGSLANIANAQLAQEPKAAQGPGRWLARMGKTARNRLCCLCARCHPLEHQTASPIHEIPQQSGMWRNFLYALTIQKSIFVALLPLLSIYAYQKLFSVLSLSTHGW
jgi:hypothetical protein